MGNRQKNNSSSNQQEQNPEGININNGAEVPKQITPFLNQSRIAIMNNKMCIRKSSVRLVPCEGEQQKYQIMFNLDYYYDVKVTVHLFKTEKTDWRNWTLSLDYFDENYQMPNAEQNFYRQGTNISFTNGQTLIMDSISQDLLTKKDNYYPLIIVLEKIIANPEDAKKVEEQKIFYYYYQFKLNSEDNLYQLELIAQKMHFAGECFQILEIYGIKQSQLPSTSMSSISINNNNNNQSQMEDKLCIVCLTEVIDTIIMPCRHMCLCVECAKGLQSSKKSGAKKCPICKKQMEAFVRFRRAGDLELSSAQKLQN